MSNLSHRTTRVAVLLLAISALLAACGKGGSQTAQAAEGAPPAQQVKVIELQPRDLPAHFEYVGRLEALREVEIRPRVTGLIVERLFEEGSRVMAGETLFRLDAAPFVARKQVADATLAEAQARLKQTEREVKRLTPLAREQAVSQRDLDDALSNRDLARASVALAEAELMNAQLELDYTHVDAPIDGRIGLALRVEGSLVSPTSGVLAYLTQTDPIYVRFSISENERLTIDQQVAEGSLRMPPAEQTQVSIRMSDGSTYPTKGQLDFTDYRADPQTGAFAMRAALPNSEDRLNPGQFVRVRVEGALYPHALAVPQRAVQEDAKGKFVYVVARDEEGGAIAMNRPVEVGQWVESTSDSGTQRLWIIRSGLKAGDQVVIDGTARIFYPGMSIDPQPADATEKETPPTSAAAQTGES